MTSTRESEASIRKAIKFCETASPALLDFVNYVRADNFGAPPHDPVVLVALAEATALAEAAAEAEDADAAAIEAAANAEAAEAEAADAAAIEAAANAETAQAAAAASDGIAGIDTNTQSLMHFMTKRNNKNNYYFYCFFNLNAVLLKDYFTVYL